MIPIAFDSVPWAIGGGAEHSSEVARLVTYIATGGQQGVLGPLDLLVLPLSVPGQGVRVEPGACVIVNQALNVSYDSYVARMPSETTVATTANGPGSTRYDLICARVENPYISGEPWSIPGDVTVGPYVFVRVIENVPSGTKTVDELDLGYTAIPLARLAIPANTSTITAGMITDLRATVNPAASPVPSTDADGGDVAPTIYFIILPSSGSNTLPYTQQSYTDWPSAAQWNVSIPRWSTHLELDIEIKNFAVTVADLVGTFQVLVNGVSAFTQAVDITLQVAGKALRSSVHLGGTYQLPTNLRGTTVVVKVQAKYANDGRCTNGVTIADTVTLTHGHHRHHCHPSSS